MTRTCPYRGAPKPFCQCGCGRRVSSWQNQWATQACVPRSVRTEGAKKGRRRYTIARRSRFFQQELARLLSVGPKLAREDILAVFHDVYERGRANGAQAVRHAQRAQIARAA